jgi:U3 small nucleolar RNA-associated protein 18
MNETSVPQMPIYSASFLGDTGKVVLSGRRNFFYMYDLVAGKVDLIPKIHGRDERSWERHTVSPDGSLIAFVGNDGYVVLVDSHSKQCIGTLKLNGSVRAITFTPDGSCIVASGSDGDIYRYVHFFLCVCVCVCVSVCVSSNKQNDYFFVSYSLLLK